MLKGKMLAGARFYHTLCPMPHALKLGFSTTSTGELKGISVKYFITWPTPGHPSVREV
jgi:hypothetical protein